MFYSLRRDPVVCRGSVALDRFVTLRNPPSKRMLETVIRTFFGGGASQITWSNDRFFVTLHGTNEERERWIEVWFRDNKVDVLTRQQDAYTNALADGLLRCLAQLR